MLEEFFKSLKETDPEAVAALNAAKTEGEVLDILRSHGLEVASIEELKSKIADEGGINQEDLETVAGGFGIGVCVWGGAGLMGCTGIFDTSCSGPADPSDCYGTGSSWNFCVIFGF